MLVCSVTSACADAGSISLGGSAHLLAENKTVALRAEKVMIVIGKKRVTVDCRFDFINNGPACKVRMGFPDKSITRTGEPPKGTFLSYKSYVDGEKTRSELVKNDEPFSEVDLWHASDVEFAANATRSVRDVYTTRPGFGVADENTITKNFAYVLETGRSWSGLIKEAEISITFEKRTLPSPIHVKWFSSDEDLVDFNWKDAVKGTVLISGPSQVSVEGQTIHFHLKDFKPRYEDNVVVLFDHMNSGPSKEEAKSSRKTHGTKKGNLAELYAAMKEACAQKQSAKEFIKTIRKHIRIKPQHSYRFGVVAYKGWMWFPNVRLSPIPGGDWLVQGSGCRPNGECVVYAVKDQKSFDPPDHPGPPFPTFVAFLPKSIVVVIPEKRRYEIIKRQHRDSPRFFPWFSP
jgi:hypothetical protein